MSYLLLESGIEYAKALSAAMWGLTRPEGDNSTKHYVGWLEHADGRAALQVLGEAIETEDEDGNPAYVFTESQPIHKDCDASAFRAVIGEPFIIPAPREESTTFPVPDDFVGEPIGEDQVFPASVTQAEADAIQAGIEAAKGGRMSFLQVVMNSPRLSPRLKTKEELEADGWFPDPVVP